MTDLPIIMSAPMVLATLREIEKPGTGKTMTRRLARRAEKIETGFWTGHRDAPSPWQRVKAGDRMWVREGWRWNVDYESTACYRADYPSDNTPPVPEPYYRWRSPLHLARAYSRLTLIVTATKIERLQDIDHIDALREGIERRVEPVDGKPTVIFSADFDNLGGADLDPVRHFQLLWTWLHGKESWGANPEVVCLTFRPVLANIDTIAKEAA